MRHSGESFRSSLVFYLLLQPVLCHMQMSWPYPLKSSFNPANNYQNIDYSMTSPLLADGSNFPCKGYLPGRPHQSVVTYTAGSEYNMTLAGTATHQGGSCQLSLSYDNGATFKVIKSMIGGCPLTDTYSFTIPSQAPAGSAIFAWTWQNYMGNREFYMNCAEVTIAPSSSSRKHRRKTNLNSLPNIWVANLEDVNSCTTTEAENPVYPNPGPDVEYGADMDSSDARTPGRCEVPAGRQINVAALVSSAAALASASSTIPDSQLPSSTTDDSSQSSTASPTFLATVFSFVPSNLSTSASGTAPSLLPSISLNGTATTSFIGTASSVFRTTFRPTLPTLRSSLRSSTFSTSILLSSILSSSTLASSTSSTSSTTSTTTSPTSITTSTTSTAASSPSLSALLPSASPSPPYVDLSDLTNYLPCVPNTFICTSTTTWYTCVGSSASDSAYLYPRPVAAGTECFPQLSPYSVSTRPYSQQAGVPQGFYRDDRIGRARPDGACDTSGAILCTNGGTSFDICDQGGWVQMGPVASGTTCINGEIIAD